MTQTARACWYRKRTVAWDSASHRRTVAFSKPLAGTFHTFGTDHEEYENGPGPYMVAVVEDEQGAVHVVPAVDVCFGTQPAFAD